MGLKRRNALWQDARSIICVVFFVFFLPSGITKPLIGRAALTVCSSTPGSNLRQQRMTQLHPLEPRASNEWCITWIKHVFIPCSWDTPQNGSNRHRTFFILFFPPKPAHIASSACTSANSSNGDVFFMNNIQLCALKREKWISEQREKYDRQVIRLMTWLWLY